MTPNEERLLRLAQARARVRAGCADKLEADLVLAATREDWLAIEALKESAPAPEITPAFDLSTYESMCESVPELELLRAVWTYGQGRPADATGFVVDVGDRRLWLARAQNVVRGYRIDLALLAGSTRLAVEVDGFEHHDATPELAERDKARQRVLVGSGWVVVPFAAREVSRDPRACAYELFTIASQRRAG